ncbi:hypothetical protein FQN49_004058, partial [Arthroderma sp. PD_2]
GKNPPADPGDGVHAGLHVRGFFPSFGGKPPGSGKPEGGSYFPPNKPNTNAPGQHDPPAPPPHGQPPHEQQPAKLPDEPKPKQYTARVWKFPMDRSKEVREYRESGKRAYDRLEGVVDNKDIPDVEKPLVRKWYEVDAEENDSPVDAKTWPSQLASDIEISTKDKIFTQFTVKNDPEFFNDDVKISVREPIHRAAYSPEKETIVVKESYAENDIFPDSVRGNFKWSEFTYQGWKRAVEEHNGDVKVGGLKWIVRDNIINPGSTKVIKEVRAKAGIPNDKEATFKPTDEDPDGFYALAGTPNARGVLHMLADHHMAFDDLKVVGIRTYPTEKASHFLLVELGKS